MAELSAEEKKRVLEALERDREFRYSLMGLLGYREILDRITRLEERFARLEERQQRLEERQQKLEERFAKLEERFARLEERQQRLEERFEKRMTETHSILSAIAHRFGIITEKSFREGMKYVVEEVFGVAEVSRWTYYDEEGSVYGHPAVIDVDVLIKDKEHILVEVKSRVNRGDLSELHRIGKLYERVRGVKPRLAMVGAFIDSKARELASSLSIEIKPITSK